jgi:GDPmannose 4,6-dehydratase
VGLNWQDFVRVDPNLMRPTDLALGLGNPQKAKEQLGWQAKCRAKDVVKMMVTAFSVSIWDKIGMVSKAD